MSKGFSLGGRRTVITAMFCDIRDFTTLTEANDPAVVIDLINQYYRILIGTVQAHGGNANQMQGDGLMSFFGAPVAHSDHARRAVASALAIRPHLAVFNSEQAQSGGLQIEVGIGIATGPVVAGYVGTASRASYMCVGDSVNLCARLESHTKVAHRPIIIDESTWRELDASIGVESLGEEVFKGKTVPVRVYAVRTL